MLRRTSKDHAVGSGPGTGRELGLSWLVSMLLVACPAKPGAEAVAPGHDVGGGEVVDTGSGRVSQAVGDGGETNEETSKNRRARAPEISFSKTSDLELRYQGEGRTKVALAGALVVLEEDYRHLRAIDLETGAERWRLLAQGEPRGMHELHSYGDRVLLHAGGRLVIVDARKGRRIGDVSAVYNGGGCHLQIEGDACAYVCECMIQPIDCTSGAEVGSSYSSSENHIYFEIDEHESVCPIRPQLLGRKDELTVALVEGKDGLMGAVAFDTKGSVRWRREGLLSERGTFSAGWISAGMAADGSACWLAEHSSGELEVFECATGKQLWRTVVVTEQRLFHVCFLPADGGRLWLQTSAVKKMGGSVEVRDLQSGRRIWAQDTGGGISPWPRTRPFAGADLPQPTKLHLYDGSRGKVLRELEYGAGSVIVDDPRGGFLLAGDELTEFDEEAKIRRRRPRALPGLYGATAEHLVVGLPGDVGGTLVLRREDLTPSMRIDGQVAWVAMPGLGAGMMLFEGQRDEAPSRLFVVGPRRTTANVRR